MENLIITTHEELTDILKDLLDGYLRTTHRAEVTPPEKMGIAQAAEFLTSKGYKISNSGIRRLIVSNEIPHKRFGGRIILSRKELLLWAEMRSQKPQKNMIAANNLASSARRQSSSKK